MEVKERDHNFDLKSWLLSKQALTSHQVIYSVNGCKIMALAWLLLLGSTPPPMSTLLASLKEALSFVTFLTFF